MTDETNKKGNTKKESKKTTNKKTTTANSSKKKNTATAKKSTTSTKKANTSTKKSTAAASKSATSTKKKTSNASKSTTKKTSTTSKKSTNSSKAKSGKTNSTKSTNNSIKKVESENKNSNINKELILPKRKEDTVLEEVTVNDIPEVVKDPNTLAIEHPKKEVEARNQISEEASSQTILGTTLLDGSDEDDKKSRIKTYAKEALAFAVVIPILDLFAMLFVDAYKPILITNDSVSNIVLTLVVDFVLIFGVTFLIDYIVGEDSVKKNRK